MDGNTVEKGRVSQKYHLGYIKRKNNVNST